MKVLALQNLYCQGVDCAKGATVDVSEDMGKYLLKKEWVSKVEKPKTKAKAK